MRSKVVGQLNRQCTSCSCRRLKKNKTISTGWVGFLCQRRAFSFGRWILVVKGLGRRFDRVNTYTHMNNGPVWGRSKCMKMQLRRRLPLLRQQSRLSFYHVCNLQQKLHCLQHYRCNLTHDENIARIRLCPLPRCQDFNRGGEWK